MWRTCHISTEISERRVPEYRVATLFPLREREIAFADGPVHVDSFHAAGDGSYSTSTTVMAGTGLFGLALGAATMAGSAIGNASRRSRAEADATRMWRRVVLGSVVVTSQGFYLLDDSGIYPWTWQSIDLMQVVGFSQVILQGSSSTGPVTWRLTSDWAELVFVLWAMSRHPQHPQLVDGSWIPNGWIDWAARNGYPVRRPSHPSLPG